MDAAVTAQLYGPCSRAASCRTAQLRRSGLIGCEARSLHPRESARRPSRLPLPRSFVERASCWTSRRLPRDLIDAFPSRPPAGGRPTCVLAESLTCVARATWSNAIGLRQARHSLRRQAVAGVVPGPSSSRPLPRHVTPWSSAARRPDWRARSPAANGATKCESWVNDECSYQLLFNRVGQSVVHRVWRTAARITVATRSGCTSCGTWLVCSAVTCAPMRCAMSRCWAGGIM